MDSIKPGPLSRCTSMAEAIIVSVNADAFSNSGCIQCSTGATEISNLFSLLSPFPLVEFLSLLECKDLFPIVLHADDCPAIFLRLVIERLRKRSDFGVGQPMSGAVRILSLCIVVQHEHRNPSAVARFGVFEHLLVAGGIAERSERPSTDHQVNALRLTGIIIIQKHLRLLGQERLAILVVAIRRAAHGADDLLGWDAIGLLGKLTHEILPTAGDNV